MASDVSSRMESLSQDTGVVGYFRPLHIFKVTDMRKAESACHKALKDLRREGEFFEIDFQNCFRICFNSLKDFLDPRDSLYDKNADNLSISSGNPVSDAIIRLIDLEACVKKYCGTCANGQFITDVVLSALGEQNDFLDNLDLRRTALKVALRNSSKMKIFQSCLVDLNPKLFVAWEREDLNEFSSDYNKVLERWSGIRRIFDHYHNDTTNLYNEYSNTTIHNIDCLSIVENWLRNKPGYFIAASWKQLINHNEMHETDFSKNISSIKDEFHLAYERLPEKYKLVLNRRPAPDYTDYRYEPNQFINRDNYYQRDVSQLLEKQNSEIVKKKLKHIQQNWREIVGEEYQIELFPLNFHGRKKAALRLLSSGFTFTTYISDFTNFRKKINDAITPMHIDHIDFKIVTQEYFKKYIDEIKSKT